MLYALRSNWQLFSGIFMLMMGNGLLATLLTIRGTELGFSETVIGMVQAAYPVGALVSAFLAPKLVERVGHERNNATAEVRRSVAGNYGPLYQAAYMLGGLQIRCDLEEYRDPPGQGIAGLQNAGQQCGQRRLALQIAQPLGIG